MVKLGNVALDGTKMKANASKHKAMSYERMDKEMRACSEGQRSVDGGEAADAEEDAEYGKDSAATSCRRSCGTPKRELHASSS